MKFMLRALRYPNYRLFFGGQIVSLIGTWMTNIAMSWLVFRLTGSAFLLGMVGFAGQFPAFLASPFAGILVDRWNRHHLLILTQTLSMLESFALAALTLSHRMTVPLLLVLTVFQGLINAFDMPCRQTFVVEMIENKEDLGNAIALNSSMFNVARLLGPSIGGLLIAAAGEGWCFLIDGISYLAVIAALFAMTFKTTAGPRFAHADAITQFKEGWAYVSDFHPIRAIISLLALVSLVGIPYAVLMPIFAGQILHGGPHALGLLMAASGSGALVGALWLASRKSVLGLGRVIVWATALFGMGLVGFASSRILWVSAILMVVTGFGFMVQMASSNTILQTIVEDNKRGRVMSFFMMAFLGTMPFGSLLAGSLSERIGAPHTLLISGFCCMGGALWFARGLPELRTSIRPIYIQMGIIKEVSNALGSTAIFTTPPET
jgi:MFS family permease